MATPSAIARKIRPRYQPFVKGAPTVPATAREDIPVYNPANGEVLTLVTSASAEDVEAAIQHAHRVFQRGTWSKEPALHRSKTLSRLARILETRIPDLAVIESLQTGRTIREMNAQLARLPEWIDYYAALLRTTQDIVSPTQGPLLNYIKRVPLGVVAQITPFNHPLLISIKKLAPALATGNSVVIKPSELAPITVLEFAEMVTEAGVPDGALTVLPGSGRTGKAIVNHHLVRKVDLTAGSSTGRTVGAIAGHNLASYTAELGGKAPIVVFDDADLPSAVNGAAFAAFVASGQTCVSGTRLLLQQSVYPHFMQMFLEKVASITRRMGNPQNPMSTMGTVISRSSLERIGNMLAQTKGVVVAGGKPLTGPSELDGFDFSSGSFLPPTIVGNVELNDVLWTEEIFGPVLVVKTFSTEEEGITLANHCKYGLGAGIWTSNLSRAHRVSAALESGLCWVNTHHRNDPSSPWGGMKESGIGRENGIEAFESYSQSKSTIVNIASSETTQAQDDWFSEGQGERRYG